MNPPTGAARPLVGVIACNSDVRGEPAASVMHRYILPLARHASVSMLLIPSLPDLVDVERIVGQIDGLFLTGSPSNVDPARYGESDGSPGPLDPDRDEVSSRLVRALIDAGKPVLGICRGLQEINVALGGSLQRDLGRAAEGRLAHHAAADIVGDAMFEHRHLVEVARDGILAELIGETKLTVNSVHYQGIARLAPDLRVEARAPDGTIEAVGRPGGKGFFLAVQWHPEWDADRDAAARAIFVAFGRAAEARRSVAWPKSNPSRDGVRVG